MEKHNQEIYPSIDDPDFNQKLFKKKEYNILYKPLDQFADIKAFRHQGLIFKQHQIFASTYINPFTNYRRALLFYSTGSGKTLAAYLVSKNFIEQFKIIRENNALNKNLNLHIPNVKILGFTKDNIKLEFLRYPELGFISEDEKKYLETLKNKFGSDSNEFIYERTKYLARLSNKNYGGYFNFHGYQEIVNKLFIFKNESVDYKILNIHKLYDEIVKGNIEINYEFLNEFKDTLIICDEIHNIYNSAKINNYGLAILYILLNNKNTKMVGLSATPLNNNPREIVDLINILSIENVDEILDETVYFNIINSYKTNIKKVLKNEEENVMSKKFTELEHLVKKYLSGKILLYENIDLRYYPSRTFIGEFIPGISLLPFIKCYMSDYFFENYIEIINFDKHSNDCTLNIANNIYEDIIMPEKILDERQLQNKSAEYKKKYDLYIDNGFFFGDFFIKKNLQKYSSKYYEMLNRLEQTKGKVFIYHKYIHKSGVLMIESILKNNGYISYDGLPNDYSSCLICKKILKEHHNKNIDHEFCPNKYVSLTSLNENNMRKNLINMFNSSNNIDGSIINIIIGSQVIEEGIELKGVNDLFVMSLPTNIATFIQVIGRCIRTNSHISLPPEKQYVNISTFVTSYTEEQKKKFIQHFESSVKDLNKILTVDEIHYFKKVNDHLEIQILEKFMKEIAVDNGLYDLKTFEDELFYSFKIREKNSFNYNNLDLSTYVHYEFINNIVDFTVLFIKELFLRYKVLSISEIFEKFDKNDFQIQYNSALIDKNLIVFILNKFILDTNIKNYLVKISIYQIPGHKIIKIDKYYILINKNNYLTNDLLTSSTFSNKISLIDYLGNIDDIYINFFKKIEDKIKNEDDFVKYILSSNIDIPSANFKNLIINSNNKIIKKIYETFKSKINQKLKLNKLIGVFNEKYQFIINDRRNNTDELNNNNFEFKGFAATSLKKNQLIQILEYLNIKTKELFSTKEMANKIKYHLFYKHLESKDSIYFVIKFLF